MNMKSVEGWYLIFQTLSVIFVMLTVGTGAGTIITGYIANRRQTEKIANLEKDAADARRRQSEAETRQAEAETRLAEAETRLAEAQMQLAQLRKKLEPRFIRPGIFKNALSGAAPHTVEILYPKENDEAFVAAAQLVGALREISGWSVSDPKPLSALASTSSLPPMLAAGAQTLGITIRTNKLDGAAKSVRKTLSGEGFDATSVLDEKLPDNTSRIIVAPRL
ncbi:MAG: hypothetical protein AABN95_08360 [Acidobacteriota bacterium]